MINYYYVSLKDIQASPTIGIFIKKSAYFLSKIEQSLFCIM